MGTFTDKKAANNAVQTEGYWVLPTDLTEKLQPGYFALVKGPYKERIYAQNVRQYDIGGYRDTAMVKDAGSIRYPNTMPASKDIPVAMAAAFAGKIDEDIQPEVTFQQKRYEEGGSYCQRLGSSTRYTASHNGKPVTALEKIGLGPSQKIEEGESAYQEEAVSFWLSDGDPSVVVITFCWD